MANLSTFTAVPLIPERSEATPGLWNNIFSVISQNVDQLNSDTGISISTTDIISTNTIQPFSGNTITLLAEKISLVGRNNPQFTKIYNASWYTYGTSNESKIQFAINRAITDFSSQTSAVVGVYIPASMLPYKTSLMTFSAALRLIREGGDPSAFDVKAYGAYGDNTTDDSYAFQAAFQAAGNANLQGGTIVVPPTSGGTYLISTGTSMSTSAVLQMYGGMRLVGSGNLSSVVQLGAGVNKAIISFGPSTQASTIENIHLDGNIAGQTASMTTAHGIWLQGDGTYKDTRNRFSNIFITNCAGNGVRIDNQTSENFFYNVIVRSCGSDGWYINGNDNKLWDCESGSSTSGYGVNVQNGFNTFYGGAIFSNFADNILVTPSAGFNKFNGLDIDSARNNGINVQAPSTLIQGCDFRNNGQAGPTNTYSHIVVSSGLTGINITSNNFNTTTKSMQAAYAIRLNGGLASSCIWGNVEETNASNSGDLIGGTPGQGFLYGNTNQNTGGIVYTSGRFLDGITSLSWATVVVIDASLAGYYYLQASTDTAAILNSISRPVSTITNASQFLAIEIKNTSGVTLTYGAGFGAGFKSSGSVLPPIGKRIVVSFKYNSYDDVFVEVARTALGV